MRRKSIGFIGGGRITKIILQAFANKNVEFESVLIFDINAETIDELQKLFPFIESAEKSSVFNQSVVFIALHPPVIMELLNDKQQYDVSKKTIISLAPKVTLEKVSKRYNTPNAVRLIPNATSYINKGYNPVSFSANFHPEAKKEILELLSFLGNTFEVQESKLEGYAVLSAMLPTYFWFQWVELAKLGENMGLTADESKRTIKETLHAALDVLYSSDLTPEQVMDLIPVKPIGENQQEITEIYQTKLTGLFEKIKP